MNVLLILTQLENTMIEVIILFSCVSCFSAGVCLGLYLQKEKYDLEVGEKRLLQAENENLEREYGVLREDFSEIDLAFHDMRRQRDRAWAELREKNDTKDTN